MESSRSTRVEGLRGLLLEFEAAALAGLKNYFRYAAWLVSDIVTTPAWLILLIVPILLFLPKERWSDQVVLNTLFWGMILWDVVGAGLWSFGMTIRREQQTGTLEFLLITNANRAVLFSRSLYSRLISLPLSILYTYAIFTAIFGVNVLLLEPLHAVAALFVGLVASMGFGLLYGAAVFRFKNVGPLTSILQFVFLGLCGVFFPVTALPEPLRIPAYLLPFTYTGDLLRHHAAGTETLLPVGLEWIVFLAETAAYLVAGFASLALVEKNLKRKGLLGAY
ncbi:ABC transporter permease [Thermofilum pendens]|uniref:ABC-2 type transporter n=1 Tax=Thermofilum pendens (strain DSM 2475 / Hrk 5) TaxID=368408 RepID=A1S015_THEPD|nr:ABC transporter permease [Thermofilum pendens]ABL78795.1 ABC-2 type transporter [Thermofilum pendens Hrk 5]